MTIMVIPCQLRHDTLANWTAANPVLASGELGIELVTNKFKFGDGTTAWLSLPYVTPDMVASAIGNDSSVSGTTVKDALNTLLTALGGKEAAGVAAGLDSAHLSAFAHGDIAHANRTILNAIQEALTTSMKSQYDSYATGKQNNLGASVPVSGDAGKVLMAAGAGASGWVDYPKACIRIDIGDGVNTILNGSSGYSAPIPFAGTILGWDIVECSPVPTDSSITVDLWKDISAHYPPTAADKISASAPVTLSGAKLASSNTLTGWTTAIAVGDCIGFTVASVATAKKVQIILRVARA